MDDDIEQPPGSDHPDDLDGYGLGREALALMYLDEPAGTLSPAQVAFALGNDRERIVELMEQDEEQSSMAAADAAEARRSGSDDIDFINVSMHESRVWASSAQMKRDALAHLDTHPAERVEFALDTELREVRRRSWAWSEVLRECRESRNCSGGDDCVVHGGELVARAQVHWPHDLHYCPRPRRSRPKVATALERLRGTTGEVLDAWRVDDEPDLELRADDVVIRVNDPTTVVPTRLNCMEDIRFIHPHVSATSSPSARRARM